MLGNIEQKKLIDRNTPLYIQLLLVSYFGAENGAEQVSISSTFYTGIFCTKVVFSSYVLAKKGLSYIKCARKMLMKLTAAWVH